MVVASTTASNFALKQVTMVVVVVGNDQASTDYVRATEVAAQQVGICLRIEWMDCCVSDNAVAKLLRSYSADPSVHGVALQLPLPEHLDTVKLLGEIDGAKDVDGLGETALMAWLRCPPESQCAPDAFSPTLPVACQALVASERWTDRRRAEVVLLGIPLALLSPLEKALAMPGHSVRACPDAADDAEARELVRQADVIVVGTRRPNVIVARWVKAGCLIVDLGLAVTSTPPSPTLPRYRDRLASSRAGFAFAPSAPLLELPTAPLRQLSLDARPTATQPSEARQSLLVDAIVGASASTSGQGLPPEALHATHEEQPIRCVGSGDGLARRVAALRLRNACHAALLLQGFLEVEPEATCTALQRVDTTTGHTAGGSEARSRRRARKQRARVVTFEICAGDTGG